MRSAEVFPPGEFLQEELDARGWTQAEFAEIIGRPQKAVSQLISGKVGITPSTAIQLGEALGTSPDLWMNLESQYQLSKVQPSDNVIARKAKLYETFPVKDMIKRGWVAAAEQIDVLEQQFLQFFDISDVGAPISFKHAAKKSPFQAEMTVNQLAWLFRSRSVANGLITKKYSREALAHSLPALRALLSAPEEARHVAKILSDCGVRFVLVEALPGSKIDGACFWLGAEQPVIAMSLRLDRIDNFWFVLRHEIEHVLQGDGKEAGFILDQDVEAAQGSSEAEDIANAAASEFCVPAAALSDFVNRVAPYFSDQRVLLFAQRLNLHPGIVAGQLRRKLDRYDRWASYLVKIRPIVTSTAVVDGWDFVEHHGRIS